MRDAQRLRPESSTTGGGDVLDELERDHREVEQLFARVSLLVGADRLGVLPVIVDALSVHASVEEEVVYPAIEEAVGGGDVLAERSRGDHEEIKELLGRIDGATVDSVQLVEDLRALQLVVGAHVAIEEGEVWPAYRLVASKKDLAALTKAAKSQRAAAGGSPPDEVLVGAVGGVDQLREPVAADVTRS